MKLIPDHEKPKDCTCATNPAPMFHGKNCPVYLRWKESEKKGA